MDGYFASEQRSRTQLGPFPCEDRTSSLVRNRKWPPPDTEPIGTLILNFTAPKL